MQVLGLFEDPPYIHLAVLEDGKKSPEICSLKTFLADSSTNVKQLYIPHWKGKIATAIGSLTRQVTLPNVSDKELAKGIGFQIESVSPLPLSQIQYFLQKQPSSAFAFIASKDVLKTHLEKWKKFGIEPDLTTSIAKAQFRTFTYKFPSTPSAILVHLGGSECNCGVVENHCLIRSHTISIGINDLLRAFWEDRKKVLFESEIEGAAKQVDLLQIKAPLNPSLFKALQDIKSRLKETLTSFAEAGGIKPILFSGRVDAFCHLTKYLADSPLLEPQLSHHEALSAIAIGAGLEIFNTKQVQFLTDEFYPDKLLSKIGGWGISSFLFSAFISLAIAICSHQFFAQSKHDMIQTLSKLFSDHNLGHITENTFDRASKLMDQSIRLPYFLANHFSVSSFLHNLTTHHLFNLVKWKNINYELISYPNISEEKKTYKVKILLEFETENGTIARKIHDSLLSGEWIADPSEDISWENIENIFSTRFILKQV